MGTEPDTGPRPWLAAAAVAVLAIMSVTGLDWLQAALRDTLARRADDRMLASLAPLLAGTGYDNRPVDDRILLSGVSPPGSADSLPVYRARRAGVPVAAVMTVVAPQGYVGPIRLLVAIGADGALLGVRVMEHRETPGVGDGIDQARSAWVDGFAGRSLADPDDSRWAVRRDGGALDQVTGATFSSRAVVLAVRDALRYFRDHRDEIFAPPGQLPPAG